MDSTETQLVWARQGESPHNQNLYREERLVCQKRQVITVWNWFFFLNKGGETTVEE